MITCQLGQILGTHCSGQIGGGGASPWSLWFMQQYNLATVSVYSNSSQEGAPLAVMRTPVNNSDHEHWKRAIFVLLCARNSSSCINCVNCIIHSHIMNGSYKLTTMQARYPVLNFSLTCSLEQIPIWIIQYKCSFSCRLYTRAGFFLGHTKDAMSLAWSMGDNIWIIYLVQVS